MALKDWKKVGTNEWRKKGLLLRVYVSNSDFHYLTKVGWIAIVKHERSNKYFEDNVFPSRPKAISWANAYMRTH